MQAKSFGKIAIPTPRTPVRLTADTTLRVARLRFAAVIGETGRVSMANCQIGLNAVGFLRD